MEGADAPCVSLWGHSFVRRLRERYCSSGNFNDTFTTTDYSINVWLLNLPRALGVEAQASPHIQPSRAPGAPRRGWQSSPRPGHGTVLPLCERGAALIEHALSVANLNHLESQ